MGTALIYDEEMTKYKLLWVDPACKIEVPERLSVSYEALVRTGLSDRCVSVPPREALDAEILLVHSEEYLEGVKKTPHMTLEDLKEFTLQYGDVYFHPNIYHCAKLAAGSALQLVDSVMTGKVRNGMALVRPPGHHSMRSAASGFCVFNNVAIAARYAKQKHGAESVLYFSWHRYEHQKFWPNLRESDYDSVGKGSGAGFNVNVPWNEVGMENSDYLSVFCHVLLPVAYEFCPDLVLVCAGFDSAIGDPEGEMCATPDIFAHLTHLLMNLAGGKLCAVLEGGYNLTSLAQSVCQTVQTLLGDPLPQLANLRSPCESALESLQCVRSVQRQYWSILKHAADSATTDVSTKRIKLAKAEEEKAETAEDERSQEEKVWPEPAERLRPPVCSVSVLPDDAACPDGLKRLASSKDLGPLLVSRIRNRSMEDAGDADGVATFSRLYTLIEKMRTNEIGNGVALVPDVAAAVECVVRDLCSDLVSRVLVVCVGKEELNYATADGKMLVVQISGEDKEEQKGKYYIPVCLKKGCGDTVGFIQAVFGLLLPLGYEYDPGLVLLVRVPGSGVGDCMWQQLIGLLKGFAKGHTLVLMQTNDGACMGPTASALLGHPAPPLQELLTPLPDDGGALERMRERLQADWKMLQTTGEWVCCNPSML
uniref:Histone deacetylase 10 n=1 Tax=Poecilia latipinna TaxID=48699 RepID=A0A3B3UGE5_9TELE